MNMGIIVNSRIRELSGPEIAGYIAEMLPEMSRMARDRNLQNLASFGRVGTSTRGGFSDIGTAQPNYLLVFRLQW